MAQLLALAGFGFVAAVTPGPNNLILWASGTEFGFRRSIRHILGTALGIGAMALGVAAGIGALVTALPGISLLMKIAGTGYLLYLAWQVAGAGALARTTISKPLDLRQAAAFQLVNPKSWIFALSAMTTFRPVDMPVIAGSIAVAVTMMLVIVPTAAVWAAAGELIGQLLSGARSARIVGLVLAALLAGTVVFVWI